MKNNTPYSINFARLAFLIIAILGGIAIAISTKEYSYTIPIWVGVLGAVTMSMSVIYIEHLSRQFTLRGFSTATFGLMIGIFCAWLLNLMPLEEIIISLKPSDEARTIYLIYQSVTYLVLSFLGIALSLRSGQEDFAFIIPYIRFRQTNENEQLLILDATAVVDSRLIPLLESGALEGRMALPNFVLDEIKSMTDSNTTSVKERGERALSLLEDLKKHKNFRLSVMDNDPTSDTEDSDIRLTKVAKINNARLITTDEALTKAARLQEVIVMNIDEIAQAFKPQVIIGEKIKLAITRPGKEEHQGVGYLSDGSMIVVNQGAQHMGSMKSVIVISKLQTNSGQMVFAELEENS